jgi:hypothetical protein
MSVKSSVTSDGKMQFLFDSKKECAEGWKILKICGQFTGGYYDFADEDKTILIEPESTQFLAPHLSYYISKLRDTGFNVETVK